MKKLYKSNKNKIFTGIIGGVGEYFNIDPVLLRISWVLATAFTGFVPGIIAYFISILVVPVKNK